MLARASRFGVAVGSVALLASCSTQPNASDQPVEVETVDAADLAPSQTTGSTVPPPTVPPECDVSALEWLWTGDVIQVTNTSSARCEVYVFDTPFADPLMEPDVWLDADGVGELLIEPVGECDAPQDVNEVDLVVNGADVTVPVTIAAACELLLVAIYAVDPVDGGG